MRTLFKAMVFSAPIFAAAFFYVATQQSRMDAQIETQIYQFDRDWYEFSAQFAKDEATKDKLLKRAKEMDERLEKAMTQKDRLEKDHAELLDSMKQALRESRPKGIDE